MEKKTKKQVEQVDKRSNLKMKQNQQHLNLVSRSQTTRINARD